MPVSICLTEEERAAADGYAKDHALSLEDAFKQALFEKIEEEYDAAVADGAYREYLQGGKKSRPIGELWREQGLQE